MRTSSPEKERESPSCSNGRVKIFLIDERKIRTIDNG